MKPKKTKVKIDCLLCAYLERDCICVHPVTDASLISKRINNYLNNHRLGAKIDEKVIEKCYEWHSRES